MSCPSPKEWCVQFCPVNKFIYKYIMHNTDYIDMSHTEQTGEETTDRLVYSYSYFNNTRSGINTVTRTSAQISVSIRQVVAELFQCEPKWWTDRQRDIAPGNNS